MSLPCPKCGKPMEYLVEYRLIIKGWQSFRWPFDREEGGFNSHEIEAIDYEIDDSQFETYNCPHCDTNLTHYFIEKKDDWHILVPDEDEGYFEDAMEVTL